jgi:hypothetical protein
MLATALDLIKMDYGDCPECEAATTIEPECFLGGWFAVVTCPDCGHVVEIELNPPNEAEVRY